MPYFKKFVTPISEVEIMPRDGCVICVGVVESVMKKITKKGDIMLFVALQDMSARSEMLVFPKTYQRTKDLWVERAPVAVLGKTPREEGDNKIFVENAYYLQKENAADLARQLSLSQPTKVYAAEPTGPEQYVRLHLTVEEMKIKAPAIKDIFSMNPGSFSVYLQVGNGVVKAGNGLDWNDAVTEKIKTLLGVDNVEVQV